jgi:hypothetical protein
MYGGDEQEQKPLYGADIAYLFNLPFSSQKGVHNTRLPGKVCVKERRRRFYICNSLVSNFEYVCQVTRSSGHTQSIGVTTVRTASLL